MKFLIDNDIIEKLCRFDLASDAVQHVFGGVENCLVLPTAKYKYFINKPLQGERKFGATLFGRIKEQFELLTAIDDAALEQLLDFEDELAVDPGEAVLVTYAVQKDDRLVVSGDKRFIVSLALSSRFEVYRNAMQGRFLCLEQVLLKLIDQTGFEHVLNRVVPARGCDTAIRAVFGSGLSAEEANVRSGLANYIADLNGRAGGLLQL